MVRLKKRRRCHLVDASGGEPLNNFANAGVAIANLLTMPQPLFVSLQPVYAGVLILASWGLAWAGANDGNINVGTTDPFARGDGGAGNGGAGNGGAGYGGAGYGGAGYGGAGYGGAGYGGAGYGGAGYGGAGYGGAGYGGAGYGGAGYGGAGYGGAGYGGDVSGAPAPRATTSAALREPVVATPVAVRTESPSTTAAARGGAPAALSTANTSTLRIDERTIGSFRGTGDRTIVVVEQGDGVKLVRLAGRIGGFEPLAHLTDELFALDASGEIHPLRGNGPDESGHAHTSASGIQSGDGLALANGEALAFGRAPARDRHALRDTAVVARVKRNGTLAWRTDLGMFAPASCDATRKLCAFAHVEATVVAGSHALALIGFARGELRVGTRVVKGARYFNRALIQLDLHTGLPLAALALGAVAEGVLASNGNEVCVVAEAPRATANSNTLACYRADGLGNPRLVRVPVAGLPRRLLFLPDRLALVTAGATHELVTLLDSQGRTLQATPLAQGSQYAARADGVLSVAPASRDATVARWQALHVDLDGRVRRGQLATRSLVAGSARLHASDAGVSLTAVERTPQSAHAVVTIPLASAR